MSTWMVLFVKSLYPDPLYAPIYLLSILIQRILDIHHEVSRGHPVHCCQDLWRKEPNPETNNQNIASTTTRSFVMVKC